MNSHLLGKQGEVIAANYFIKKGFKLRELNFHSRFGEIDIVVQKKNLVVFVEVKARKNKGFAAGADSVDLHKQARIKKTALYWTSEYDQDYTYRFDVVEYYLDDNKLNHIENAFY